jgi:3'-phosphoadenosine 5'-phosphosulfate sulfotransferase (PAPS reductase)/FAD synthetase
MDIAALKADPGVLFVLSHSGGKDSQAMMIDVLAQGIPAARLLVVHATFEEEWAGALELAQKQAQDAGVAFRVARPIFKDGATKGFINMVERSAATRPGVPPFPSVNQRRCTSELKVGPIEVVIRQYAKAKRFTRIVSCEGIRAAESEDRRKRVPFIERTGKHDGLARAGRRAWTWYPIFHLTTAQVFETIAQAGQEPHWAYAQGNERLSCVFCFLGSVNDLRNGARLRPDLFAKYDALERATGYTLHMSRKPLRELVGDAVALAA